MNENTISSQEQTELLLLQIERLKQQNTVLVSELNANTEQVGGLKEENKELSQELSAYIQRTKIGLFQAKDKTLLELDQQCNTLQSQVQQDTKTIQALMRRNTELQKTNEQYELIVDKLQNEEITLGDQLRQETKKLHELQSEYNDLGQECANQMLVAKRTSKIAEELQSELTDVKIQEERLHDEKTQRIDADFEKTLRVDPHTLNSLQYQRVDMYDAFHEDVYDYANDAVINTVRDQLQIEFDDKLGKEKGKLIEKHKLEIAELKAHIVEFKKKLIAKDNETAELSHVHRRRRVCEFVLCCQDTSIQ